MHLFKKNLIEKEEYVYMIFNGKYHFSSIYVEDIVSVSLKWAVAIQFSIVSVLFIYGHMFKP